jgi:hypothetical protein
MAKTQGNELAGALIQLGRARHSPRSIALSIAKYHANRKRFRCCHRLCEYAKSLHCGCLHDCRLDLSLIEYATFPGGLIRLVSLFPKKQRAAFLRFPGENAIHNRSGPLDLLPMDLAGK